MGAWPLSPGHAPPFFDLAALARLSPRLRRSTAMPPRPLATPPARSLSVSISLRSPRLPPPHPPLDCSVSAAAGRYACALAFGFDVAALAPPPTSPPGARLLRLRGRWPLRLRARFRFRSRCARLASHLPTRRSTAPSPRPLATPPARSLSVSMSLRSPRLPPPHPALDCSVSAAAGHSACALAFGFDLAALASPPTSPPAARLLRLRGRWPLRLRARPWLRSCCARPAPHPPHPALDRSASAAAGRYACVLAFGFDLAALARRFARSDRRRGGHFRSSAGAPPLVPADRRYACATSDRADQRLSLLAFISIKELPRPGSSATIPSLVGGAPGERRRSEPPD